MCGVSVPGSPVPSTPERSEGLRACYWEGPSPGQAPRARKVSAHQPPRIPGPSATRFSSVHSRGGAALRGQSDKAWLIASRPITELARGLHWCQGCSGRCTHMHSMLPSAKGAVCQGPKGDSWKAGLKSWPSGRGVRGAWCVGRGRWPSASHEHHIPPGSEVFTPGSLLGGGAVHRVQAIFFGLSSSLNIAR